MIILDLCGGSGAWSRPWKKAGYDVRIIDIENEFGEDVRFYGPPRTEVYGVLAAPPCTHLAASGARWWKNKGAAALLEALSIVDACLRVVMVTRPVFWALENPVGRLTRFLGKPRMYFDPCDYGDPWTKKTALWGDFKIPEKSPVKPTETDKIHKVPGSKMQSYRRSITPAGFSRAFFEANRDG